MAGVAAVAGGGANDAGGEGGGWPGVVRVLWGRLRTWTLWYLAAAAVISRCVSLTPTDSVAWLAAARRRLPTPLSVGAAAGAEAARPVPAAPRASSSSRSGARALIEQVRSPTGLCSCMNVSLKLGRSSPWSSMPLSRSKVAVPSVCSFRPPLPLSVSVSCAPSAAESERSAASSAARSSLPG